MKARNCKFCIGFGPCVTSRGPPTPFFVWAKRGPGPFSSHAKKYSFSGIRFGEKSHKFLLNPNFSAWVCVCVILTRREPALIIRTTNQTIQPPPNSSLPSRSSHLNRNAICILTDKRLRLITLHIIPITNNPA